MPAVRAPLESSFSALWAILVDDVVRNARILRSGSYAPVNVTLNRAGIGCQIVRLKVYQMTEPVYNLTGSNQG